MLTHLHIGNLAVVDDAALELDPGLTVLTGETGAGKSMLIDALLLATGTRAESRAVRTGAKRLEVSATFDISGRPDLVTWLTERDLDDADECVLRRVVTAEGRSRGYLNGRPVPVQTLREIGERLVDICGQQAHQALRRRGAQREIVDAFGNHGALLEKMRNVNEQWLITRAELDEAVAARKDFDARRELLQFRVTELDALDLKPGEFEELEAEHRLLSNSQQIIETISSALDALYENEDGTASAIVTRARQALDSMSDADAALTAPVKLLREVEIGIDEAVDALRQRLSQLEVDPQRLAQIEQRIDSTHELARKHRIAVDELPPLAESLRTELDELENSGERLAELEQRATALDAERQSMAAALTKARKKAAAALAKQVSQNMHGLGMPDGSFSIAVEPRADGGIHSDGADAVEFMVSANPGQASGPLAKFASGGELSRINLALQVAATADTTISTLIFDEVDAGIGGGVAEMVGAKLQALGQSRQVMCVTHLPQVASKGNQHFRISKLTDGKITRTTVKRLNAKERIDEVARMLGGVEITRRTLDHAEEMLSS